MTAAVCHSLSGSHHPHIDITWCTRPTGHKGDHVTALNPSPFTGLGIELPSGQQTYIVTRWPA